MAADNESRNLLDRVALQHAERAWAAGFYDGEGTCGWRLQPNRPGQRRVRSSVTQASRNGQIPIVLLRFHSAVGGLGAIGAPYVDRQHETCMYSWSTDGFESVQAVVATLWPWLGEVKRRQAATALAAFRGQFTEGRSPRFRAAHYTFREPDLNRDLLGLSPNLVLAWAAGFFDADGWVGLRRRVTSAGPIAHLASSISQRGDQAVPGVLLRFRDAVRAGRIEGPFSGRTFTNAYKWVAGHADTPRVFGLLWPYLCEVKREQARAAFAIPTGRVRKRDVNGRFMSTAYHRT